MCNGPGQYLKIDIKALLLVPNKWTIILSCEFYVFSYVTITFPFTFLTATILTLKYEVTTNFISKYGFFAFKDAQKWCSKFGSFALHCCWLAVLILPFQAPGMIWKSTVIKRHSRWRHRNRAVDQRHFQWKHALDCVDHMSSYPVFILTWRTCANVVRRVGQRNCDLRSVSVIQELTEQYSSIQLPNARVILSVAISFAVFILLEMQVK